MVCEFVLKNQLKIAHKKAVQIAAAPFLKSKQMKQKHKQHCD
jgi:hypothetical protein